MRMTDDSANDRRMARRASDMYQTPEWNPSPKREAAMTAAMSRTCKDLIVAVLSLRWVSKYHLRLYDVAATKLTATEKDQTLERVIFPNFD
jgi:hypothetical protein